MNGVLGALAGLGIWAILFLFLPQEFLGTVVGRPFEFDDGQIIVRYPWGMFIAAVALIGFPIIGARTLSGKS